ncbi:capsular exopolysaccharide family [Anaeromyxobacter sp. K]|uniref:polysaccharide biosynthesis tyrosine autokinase n=1 Tax=Anaeromyxobacter sp. (strain K) TaxID=447217 RepID=UPI00015F9198|nr:polysaccharide biosynthesis tyrosine autokinase [Anaeromyxobacter sp. K]ACG75611.1 capsular exopolysaccharide family [Anaeromyxobacter sp. K]
MTPKPGGPALEMVPDKRPAPPPEPAYAGDADGDEVSLAEYLDVLVQGRWLIAGAAAVALACGVAYALLATPVYRSDALVQVEDKKGGTGALGDLSALFSEASPAETEMEILRSRSLVGSVVDALKLEISAEPRRFPVVGRFLARRHKDDAPASAMPGFGRYGWGGEKLTLGRLAVPEELEGEPLTLEAREGGRFALLDPDGELLVEGAVGAAASGRRTELFVAELVARPGTQFRVSHQPRDAAIADLQDGLRISEKGKKTGVIQLALEDEDPARAAAILDALSSAYLRQNVERKSAEAEKTLEFLETQLPELRGKLDVAERDLETYRSAKGSVDVSMETQAALTRAVDIEKAASELQLEIAALRQRFTEDHPLLIAARQKMGRLDEERRNLEARMRKLPEAELESARRLRDVKVANELYLTLLNKAQELKVVKEGTVGNVRILDAALVPLKPVAPKRGAVVALALLLGLAGGVALAFVRKALDQGVEDPDALERATGVGVHASVPHSDAEGIATRAAGHAGKHPVLARTDPNDLAVEALRSLRTSVQFALLEASSNVVTVGGPAPGIGKSFVTANLAVLLAEAGKRVVVVDADLRRGHLHRFLGGERAPGLTDVLSGAQTLASALRTTEHENIQLLTTGTIPPNPAELLGSDRFQRLLADLSAKWDLVVVDTPPILAVADGALIARQAGVNLFVVKAGKHPIREIQAGLRQLTRAGARVHGIVMNDVRLDRGLGRRSAYHYQYSYK